jgi:hypothetical protein
MLYVLELSQNKYYVGKTLLTDAVRIRAHFRVDKGGGCTWTRLYTPVSVLYTCSGDSEQEENILTLQMMNQYGWENVRGGKWCQVSLEYSPLQLPHKFPFAKAWSKKRFRDGTCIECDNSGHFANVCPQRVCSNCKKQGHSARVCLYSIVCHLCKESGHISSNCPHVVCYTCKKKGHTTKSCPAKNNKSLVVCLKCFDVGHVRAECINDEKCMVCKQTGHTTKECQVLSCHTCHKLGHISSMCPSSSSNSAKEVCFRCKKPGHFIRDCEQKKK